MEAAKEACRNIIKNHDIMEPGKPDHYASMKTQLAAKGMVRLAIQEISAIDPADVLAKVEAVEADVIKMTYRNYRGEVSRRTISPISIWFGTTDWHPEPGWLLSGIDMDKGERRDFALADCQFVDLSPAPDAVARLVEAANQARMAFAGYISAQSAIDKLDAALAAMETNHD